ncbi:MAG: MATE family efflux transporter [Gammaproteobacteria bacterium]|nr:MATE family efflux transporter [Gammaproteobacteria bacterium]
MSIKQTSEISELFKLGIPAILAQLSQMALGVIDTMMAGSIDAEALAAIAVGTNIINPIIVFILGVFLALNPIVAHLNGRGSFEQIGVVFQQSTLAAFIMAVPAIYLLHHTESIMQFIGIQETLHQTVSGYLIACSYGVVPLFGFLALRFCNEGLFSTRAIMIVSVLAIPFNLLFNYWFIWGGLGVPAMGAIGIGYATALVWSIMFIAMLIYSLCSPRYQHLAIKSRWHAIDWQQLKELLVIGLPMGIGVGMEIAMFAFIGLMIGRFSVEIIAAHQIAINIASMAYMIPLGLSIAISARVGFFAGRNDRPNVQIAAKTGIIVAVSIACVSSLAMYLFAQPLIKLYTTENTVLTIATQLLVLAAIFQLSDAVQVALSGALRGIKDTRIPMVISAISYWAVGFPIGYFAAEALLMSARGYWLGIVAGLTTAAILLYWRYRVLFIHHSPIVFAKEHADVP